MAASPAPRKRAPKWLNVLLIGLGAVAVMSAVVNLIATVQLIGPTEERELGISRNYLLWQYGVLAVAGVVLVFVGFRNRRRK